MIPSPEHQVHFLKETGELLAALGLDVQWLREGGYTVRPGMPGSSRKAHGGRVEGVVARGDEDDGEPYRPGREL